MPDKHSKIPVLLSIGVIEQLGGHLAFSLLNRLKEGSTSREPDKRAEAQRSTGFLNGDTSALQELLGTVVWGSGTAQNIEKHPAKRCLKTTNKIICPHARHTHSRQGNKSVPGWKEP